MKSDLGKVSETILYSIKNDIRKQTGTISHYWFKRFDSKFKAPLPSIPYLKLPWVVSTVQKFVNLLAFTFCTFLIRSLGRTMLVCIKKMV